MIGNLMRKFFKNTRLDTFYTIVPTRPPPTLSLGIYVIFNIKIGLKYFGS